MAKQPVRAEEIVHRTQVLRPLRAEGPPSAIPKRRSSLRFHRLQMEYCPEVSTGPTSDLRVTLTLSQLPWGASILCNFNFVKCVDAKDAYDALCPEH